MIYLDYSATTPVLYDVLESYNKATKDYMGNTNSLHALGVKANELLNGATKQIATLFDVKPSEIVYTSGATESNNFALIGAALEYQNRGKHIIVSKLEHPSVYAICDYLKTIGFEISYVKNDENGLIDFNDLNKLIREDTILISINAVNGEMGIRQPLKLIRQVIKKKNTKVLFHSDLTQAIGKVTVNLHDIDLGSISAHKIYGPKGIGLLYKSEKVKLAPIIHGSTNNSELRPGTIPLPLIVAMSKALRICLSDLDKKEAFVKRLNEKICSKLEKIDGVLVNKTKFSIPHILNISISDIKPETFIHALEKYEIYIGTNTACSSGDLSSSVYAVYNDKKRALSTVRISISHQTTTNEITKFLSSFEEVFNELKK